MEFATLFHKATGMHPYKYQVRLATSVSLPDAFIGPTGIGKTAALTLQWVWRTLYADEETKQKTPRRLVYCLPQRTLVEQTATQVKKWLNHLGILATKAADTSVDTSSGEGCISVHVLMGGNVDNEWELYPERRTILIGTQDQLLSRALNRGYGISRYKWPVHFALLNVDTLWVCDEVQLMGIGLETSAQLQAFRFQPEFGSFAPTHTLWASATLQSDWLKTVDFRRVNPVIDTFSLTEDEQNEGSIQSILRAKKPLVHAPFALNKGNVKKGAAAYAEAVTEEIQELHEHGTMTLVVVNRVQRAQAIYDAVRKANDGVNVLLIHSRFRVAERVRQLEKLRKLASGDCIVIATQAVEAGVDISARTLITELAPWSSLVQRFGRCNRRGEFTEARVVVVDIADHKDLVLPYTSEALTGAREILRQLDDVSPYRLPEVSERLVDGLVLRRKDLLDFFDTAADLSGANVDVSRFIRQNRDNDVQVYWRNFASSSPDAKLRDARWDELCPVSMALFRDYLKKKSKNSVRRAWAWDGLANQFYEVDEQDIYPGQTLLLNAKMGGYRDEDGFLVDSWIPVNEVVRSDVLVPSNKPDDVHDDDPDSCIGANVTLARHLSDVRAEAEKLVAAMSGDFPDEAVVEAALYHDCGKALRAFQKVLGNDEGSILLAKSRGKSKTAGAGHQNADVPQASDATSTKPERPGLRHELASALAYVEYAKVMGFEGAQTSLVAYLIASHHGKIRTSIRALPTEVEPDKGEIADGSTSLFARGVRHGDRLPAIALEDGTVLPEVCLDLRPMQMGFAEDGHMSWTEMVLQLLETYGPFRLAWLESLVRVADWRASAKEAIR
ncbi:type I-G CRISPR-associated helicase/endonuclease Cas3g [Alicyclobacillus acidoterrestris]|uniref:type I-G CRISPR-associated helicase/endonuclease Cas3g n=1 Tax=Alicyclobacillus acidoterrestris TaxID=1450 RepID=UPI003F52C46F